MSVCKIMYDMLFDSKDNDEMVVKTIKELSRKEIPIIVDKEWEDIDLNDNIKIVMSKSAELTTTFYTPRSTTSSASAPTPLSSVTV